jgi:signal recognition particle subunit SEC65
MPDHFYIYPSYLNSASRALGRRVPKDSLPRGELTLEEYLKAVKSLGFEAIIEEGKQYPRSSWKVEGRLKVTKKPGTTKNKLLKMLAAELLKSGSRKQ